MSKKLPFFRIRFRLKLNILDKYGSNVFLKPVSFAVDYKWADCIVETAFPKDSIVASSDPLCIQSKVANPYGPIAESINRVNRTQMIKLKKSLLPMADDIFLRSHILEHESPVVKQSRQSWHKYNRHSQHEYGMHKLEKFILKYLIFWIGRFCQTFFSHLVVIDDHMLER